MDVDTGVLVLNSEALVFENTASTYKITIVLDSIIEIYIDHYSRLLKPIRMNYLAIRYNNDRGQKTIYLNPYNSSAWLTSVWKCNEFVAEWNQSIKDTINGIRVE